MDKWLWAARIFKTRGLASDSCKSGKVVLNGSGAKPSKIVNEGDIIEIKQPPIIRRYKVKGLAIKRVCTKLAVDLVEERLQMVKSSFPDVEVINASQTDPIKRIKELTENNGVDIAFEAVGHAKIIPERLNPVRSCVDSHSLIYQRVSEPPR